MALLQQHNTWRNILTEPAARRRERSKLRGIRNWWRNRAVKTNQLVLITLTLYATAHHQQSHSWQQGASSSKVLPAAQDFTARFSNLFRTHTQLQDFSGWALKNQMLTHDFSNLSSMI